MEEQRRHISRIGLPRARSGKKVGLFGGSFDPPHLGHVHITRQALQRFGLDEIWWLVSPGNPLKPEGPAAFDRRIAAARAIIQHPRVCISDLEARLGTRFTASTINALQRLYPGVDFIWLMGADNLASFHKWEQWQSIMRNVSIGVLARPGDTLSARYSIAAKRFRSAQLRGRNSLLLRFSRPPCWCFVNVPMVNLSSTEIRARGGWVR